MKFGVIFGANSYEHEISIISAISLSKIIDISYFIFIDDKKNFYLIDKNNLKAKYFSSFEFQKAPQLILKHKGFYQKTFLGEKLLNMDVLINLVHGADGEDGKLAGILDFFDIKFIGPRIEASVISYNKYLTKLYANDIGVKTLPYQYFKLNTPIHINNFPIIVKPTKLGSSIGISIVNNQDELDYALDVAREFCDEVIIEPFIKNISEYNLAGCKINNHIVFSNIEKVQKNDFLDFDKKYLDFNRSKTINTEVDISLEEKLKSNFSKIYNDLFDGSLIRCDFFVVDDEVYLNEINPIPGSYANYLFNDFHTIFYDLAKNLPKQKQIKIQYNYINKINANKGK
jgi:D-alanine-D-alanine ligase